MLNVVASSGDSCQLPQEGCSIAKRLKKEPRVETEPLEPEPVFEVPQEMQQMLQTFSREFNCF